MHSVCVCSLLAAPAPPLIVPIVLLLVVRRIASSALEKFASSQLKVEDFQREKIPSHLALVKQSSGRSAGVGRGGKGSGGGKEGSNGELHFGVFGQK